GRPPGARGWGGRGERRLRRPHRPRAAGPLRRVGGPGGAHAHAGHARHHAGRPALRGRRGGGGCLPGRARPCRPGCRRGARRGGGRLMQILTGVRWQDAVDILLLAVIIYSGINLIRGTRAVPMLIGFGVLYGVYFASARLEIYTINVLLQNLLGWSLILVFIVFQNDIRRALTQVGTGPLFSSADRIAQSQAVEEL